MSSERLGETMQQHLDDIKTRDNTSKCPICHKMLVSVTTPNHILNKHDWDDVAP